MSTNTLIIQKDIKDLLLAIQLHSSNRRPTKYIDVIKVLRYSEKKKVIYNTYSLIIYHKEKLEDEEGKNKVARVEDDKYSFRNLIDIYQWLGSYYKKLNGETT